MIQIDIKEENENVSFLETKINNKRKKQTSKYCKYNNNKGEIIGKGKFGTVYEFINIKKSKLNDNTSTNTQNLFDDDNTKYVIKDSNIYAYVNKIKKHYDTYDQQLELLNYHDNEILNIKSYSDFSTQYYPNNFIKCYDTENDCAYCSNSSTNSSDSNDDEFLINQIILEKVFGDTLNKYKSDSEDIKLIFIQLLFIITNMNMMGAFHNDLKMENMMIEKKEINELILEFIIDVKDTLKMDFNGINLKSKKSYFPVVRLIDYSFSYVYKGKINDKFFPIEIFNVLELFNNIIKEKDIFYENINKLYIELFKNKEMLGKILIKKKNICENNKLLSLDSDLKLIIKNFCEILKLEFDNN
jgi:hypothetical protein